ncbi:MAG: GDSL-type esterase/lipase family protein [Patescibacteria group bacterium]|jgi:lysophospholipase L1-like esterase
MNILIFGDSIAYGAWDREGGWISRLRKFVDNKIISTPEDENYYHYIYNLGISGDTSTSVLDRFQAEVDARLLKEKDCAVVFAIGTNDSQFIFATQENKTPQEKFTANISTLITKARKYTDKIIFVGLSPVDDAKVNPIPWSPEKAYINEHVTKFDALIQGVCKDESISFVDVLPVLSSGDFTHLLKDGVHPNDAGHAMLFEAVREALVSAGWI